ncbi:MAG: ribonuclease domain-containing protein [Acidimicrobiia bacterium]
MIAPLRRFLGTVALLVVAALTAAGCGGGSSGASDTSAADTTVVLSSTTVAVSPLSTLAGASSTQLEAPEGVPQKALDVLVVIDRTGAAPAGYVGGSTFQNREKRLPQKTADGKAIRYREWDVNVKRKNVDRGPQRLVTGDDRSAYYTGDHYATFVRIR